MKRLDSYSESRLLLLIINFFGIIRPWSNSSFLSHCTKSSLSLILRLYFRMYNLSLSWVCYTGASLCPKPIFLKYAAIAVCFLPNTALVKWSWLLLLHTVMKSVAYLDGFDRASANMCSQIWWTIALVGRAALFSTHFFPGISYHGDFLPVFILGEISQQ